MNERIKELAMQAGVDTKMLNNNQLAMLTEFSKLIVQECSELTLDYVDDHYYRGWLDYRDTIRNHFGISE